MKTIEFESVLTNLVGIDKPIKMYKQKIYCDNNAVGVTIADYCRAVGLDFCGDNAVNYNYYEHKVFYRLTTKLFVNTLEQGGFGKWHEVLVEHTKRP